MEGNPNRLDARRAGRSTRDARWPGGRHSRTGEYLELPEPFDLSPQGDWDSLFRRIYAGLPIRGTAL